MAILKREDQVFILDLGDSENRFFPESVDEIMAALDEVEGASGPRGLVTTATGKYFSNGLDLEWLGSHQDQWAPFIAGVQEMLARILVMPVPTAVAIQGHAFAAGAMLTVAHDWAIMRTDRGFWCLPEVDIGLPFSPGMDALLAARLTRRTAHEAMTTGRRYGGPEALDAEIVNAVGEGDEIVSIAIERIGPLVGKAGTTLGTIKATRHNWAVQALRA